MNRRQVGGTVLATLATGVIALAVAKVVQDRRRGIDPSPEDLMWIRELMDRLRAAENGDETVRASILSGAYRDLRSRANTITSKQLRRRLNWVIKQDPEQVDEMLIDLERLLEALEEAVERRSIGKDEA